MEFFQQAKSTLTKFEPVIASSAQAVASNPDIFAQITKAAFARTYEFVFSITEVSEDVAFFMTPFLRGICEDYIVLNFLVSELIDEADKVVGLRLLEEMYQSSIAQWHFFSKNNPDQKLFFEDEFPEQEVEVRDQLRTLLKTKNIHIARKKSSLPSVRDMAAHGNLLELYDYIYHATSSLVHFNPRILLRMGWGDLPNVTFSVKNFGKYYKHFACFYGIYLFIKVSKLCIQTGVIAELIEEPIEELNKLLDETPRWPELVTFEEMNISTFRQMLYFKSPTQEQQGIKTLSELAKEYKNESSAG